MKTEPFGASLRNIGHLSIITRYHAHMDSSMPELLGRHRNRSRHHCPLIAAQILGYNILQMLPTILGVIDPQQ